MKITVLNCYLVVNNFSKKTPVPLWHVSMRGSTRRPLLQEGQNPTPVNYYTYEFSSRVYTPNYVCIFVYNEI